MSYSVSIKFKKKNDTTPQNINNVIGLIPPAYRGGHTQTNMMQVMFPSSRYTIDFRDNKNLADNFAQELFTRYGNIFDINRDYL